MPIPDSETEGTQRLEAPGTLDCMLVPVILSRVALSFDESSQVCQRELSVVGPLNSACVLPGPRLCRKRFVVSSCCHVYAKEGLRVG